MFLKASFKICKRARFEIGLIAWSSVFQTMNRDSLCFCFLFRLRSFWTDFFMALPKIFLQHRRQNNNALGQTAGILCQLFRLSRGRKDSTKNKSSNPLQLLSGGVDIFIVLSEHKKLFLFICDNSVDNGKSFAESYQSKWTKHRGN